MTMTIYESMAHVLANEHGRALFTGKSDSTYSDTGFRQRFWRWLLVAYGERLYELPGQIGLPPAAQGRPYSFPAYTINQSMSCGLAPTKLMKFPTVSGYSHQYTPLHIGTALLKFGRAEDAEEADILLSTTFMRSVYPTRSAADFTSQTYVNPISPEEVGRKPFDIELLTRPDNDIYILDELGNAAWFPKPYLEKVLGRTEPVFWYSHLCRLNALHGKWTDLVQDTAAALLRHKKDGFKMEYRSSANYLRNVRRGTAVSYMGGLSGVREILCVVRADATPEEMHRGLRCLATTFNDRTKELFRYIGRALTLDDFRRLTPKQALTILYHAPYEAVADVIRTNSPELGALFFTLTDKELLWRVTNSMSVHNDRVRNWLPDTEEGNLKHLSMSSDGRQEIINTWTKTMKELVDIYDRAKEWRDEFVDLAQPDVLLLALCRWAASEERDPIPAVAIENVLRSHPNIVPIQEMIRRMPAEIGRPRSL